MTAIACFTRHNDSRLMRHRFSIFWFWSLLIPALSHADTFSSGGVKIAYTVQGSGSPVLLIHCLHGSGATNGRHSTHANPP